MPSLFLLLVQVGLIIAAAQGLGRLVGRFRQPQVVGEMAAGLLLGPSVLGALAPEVFTGLFPAESLPALHTLSQVGLLLFMFMVGLELNVDLLRGRGRAVILTSQASIVVPFVLGVGLAVYLYPRLGDGAPSFLSFALFVGTAMSITAFPVLSRILAERNLLRTRLGALALACAAVNDAAAWFLLAGVVALVRASGATSLLVTVGGAILYAALLFGPLRPALAYLETHYHRRGRMSQGLLVVVMLALLASAMITELLGIHAIFGAFLIGTVMPKDHGFVRELRDKLEDVTVVLLLPLFFAYTGLHTQVGLLDGWMLWLDALLILVVAVVGKYGGSALAARATGLSGREASALGMLMNTRGLMELVILAVGLELGVIPPALFAMMVLMALGTTLMTTPLLAWVYPAQRMRADRADAAEEAQTVLLPVALPSSGPALLRVAAALAPPGRVRYYALHLIRSSEQSFFSTRSEHTGPDPLGPLLREADVLGVDVRPLTAVSPAIGEDLLAVANAKGADLIVMGHHHPVVRPRLFGGVTGAVLQSAHTDVVVCILRHDEPWQRILLLYEDTRHDRLTLRLAHRLHASTEATITVLQVVAPEVPDDQRSSSADLSAFLVNHDHVHLKVVRHSDPAAAAIEEVASGHDLVIVGVGGEQDTTPDAPSLMHERIAAASVASLLVVRAGRGEMDAPGAPQWRWPRFRPGRLVRERRQAQQDGLDTHP